MRNLIHSIKFNYIIFSFLSLIIVSNGCSDGGTSISDINLFSISDDVQLGKQLSDEMHLDTQNYPIYNNAQATQYVQNIVNKIIQSPHVKYRNEFNYKVTLVNTETINAFALPGGYIHVYTGLLKYIDNEATLAGILGHEICHAERRHATKRMTKAYGASFLIGLLLGQNPSNIEQIAANLLSGLGFLYNSREDEYEADEYGFKYLQSTEWYPAGGAFFFEKIKGESNNSDFAELFSTHPLDEKRIDALYKLAKDNNIPAPSENNVFTQRYQNFKKTLN